MTITVVFDPPLPSDSPATFNTKAFTTLGDLNTWSTQANAVAAEVNAAAVDVSEAVAAAATATTKAGEASASATSAAGSATSASTGAGTATTKAGEASTSATSAATSASSAATSAAAAAGSASSATTQAANAAANAATATTKASEAEASATTSSAAASTATTKANEAGASATNASNSAASAASSASSAAASYDAFDDRYLGAKSVEPAVDNDGGALITGALYFNSVAGGMRVWDGAAWTSAYVSTAGYATTVDLATKENTITAGTTAQFWRGDKTWQSLNKTDVGLSNVDNTSDASKPVSTATQTALATKLSDAPSDGKTYGRKDAAWAEAAPLASPTFTGTPAAPTAAVGTNTTQLATTAHVYAERAATATLTNKTLTTPLITGTREVRVAMPANAIDLATGNLFTKTISGATTLTVSNVPATGDAASFILELTNAGSAAITWFSGVKWAGGTAPTLTASGVDVLGFYSHNGGTTWRGMLLAKDSK